VSAVLALVADLGAAAGIAALVGPLSARSEARLRRIRAPLRRSQSVAARQLAAVAASRALGRAVPGSGVEEADDGAGLRVRDAPALCISVAHSGQYVVVAVGDRAVGIDVERCIAGRDHLAFARYAYSAAEVSWLERAAPPDRSAGFYLLWTLREAGFKAGLRASALGGESCLDPASGSAGFCWSSREFAGHRVSVVAREPVPLEWLGLADAALIPLGRPGRETLGTAGGTAA
jgi:4'-phosphopantetheinyl transferase